MKKISTHINGSLIRKFIYRIALLALFVLAFQTGQGQTVLGSWTLSSALTATSPTAGVTATTMSPNGTFSGGGFASSGYWTDASSSSSRVTGDYCQYKITVDATHLATITSFAFNYKEVSGAVTMAVYYSTDGSTFTQIGSNKSVGTVGYTAWNNSNTGLSISIGSSQSFYLRFYAWADGVGAVYQQLWSISGIVAPNCTTPTGGTITGTTPVCSGATGVTYSISGVSGTVTAYTWAVPSGTITSVNGTSTSTSCTVNWGATAGNITCTPADLTCVETARTFAVSFIPPPSTPSAINLPAPICKGSQQTYSVTNDLSVTAYNWTLPSGWSGTSAINSIAATAGSTGGTISVTATNVCNVTSSSSSSSVTVNAPPPLTPSPIVHN